eukprot:122799_1
MPLVRTEIVTVALPPISIQIGETKPLTTSIDPINDTSVITDTSAAPQKRKRISLQTQGRLFALIGSFLTAINFTLVKYLLNGEFPVPQALITRYTPPLIFVIIIVLCLKFLYSNKEYYFFAKDLGAFKILSLRAFFHWASNICTIYSLLFVPVIINLSIFYTWSLFALVLSYCTLHEKLNISNCVFTIIGLGGVIMVTNPTFHSFSGIDSSYIKGIILGLISAFLYAINMIILSKNRTSYHWNQTESVAGLWATFIFTPVYILIAHFGFNIQMSELIKLDLTFNEWIIFVLISVIAFISISAVTRALQLEKLIIVCVILYSEVAFGTLFQFIFLNDNTNFNTYGLWIGILCIIGSTCLILYKQTNNDIEPDESMKMSQDYQSETEEHK